MLICPEPLPPVQTRVGMAWLAPAPAPGALGSERESLAEAVVALLGGGDADADAAMRAAVRGAIHAGADAESVVAEAADWRLAWRAARGRARRARWMMARLRLRPRSAARVLGCGDPEAIAWALERCGAWSAALGPAIDRDPDPIEGTLHSMPALRVRGSETVRALVVRCPSTGRQHVLLVPPQCSTARDARRWTLHGHSPEVES